MKFKGLTIKSTLGAAVLAVLAAAGLTPSSAVAYPERTIRVVVPYNAGGGTDILARAIAAAAGEHLKQPVIVDNRAGASGMIGSEYVGKAAPDGYTFLMTAADTHSVNPHVYPNIRYDAVKEFRPVAQIGILPYALVVSPKLNVNTLKEFIDLAKKQPGKLTYSSWGVGSTSQVAMEMFKIKTGTDLLHVPFTGAAPAMNGVISGQTDAMFVPLSLAVPKRSGWQGKGPRSWGAQAFCYCI
jgi:tripartite-type tricarboxylate transporter receptor subunit TctC